MLPSCASFVVGNQKLQKKRGNDEGDMDGGNPHFTKMNYDRMGTSTLSMHIIMSAQALVFVYIMMYLVQHYDDG